MNNFEKIISKYWTDKYPEVWSFLWSPEEAEQIPETHKDQIHFLDSDGTVLVKDYIYSTGMGNKLFVQKPFEGYFDTVEKFKVTEDCGKEIKKWLFNRGIPFEKWVFADNNRSGQAVMLTWKMVIKYWEGLFFADDVMISDSSLEWGLYYYHEGILSYGTDVIFDRSKAEQLTLRNNEILRKITTANKSYEQ